MTNCIDEVYYSPSNPPEMIEIRCFAEGKWYAKVEKGIHTYYMRAGGNFHRDTPTYFASYDIVFSFLEKTFPDSMLGVVMTVAAYVFPGIPGYQLTAAKIS